MEETNDKSFVSSADEFKNLLKHIVTEDEIKEQFTNARKKLSGEVQKKPLVALGIAIATGFVLGSILKR